MVNPGDILTAHIRKQYKHIYALNLDEVTVIKRNHLEGRNFFSEDLAEEESFYTMKLNINPVKARGFRMDEKTVTKDLKFEVYTDPETYPLSGVDIDGNTVNVPFEGFSVTDKIKYQDKVFKVAELENVAMNQNPQLWQRFFLQVLN